MTNVKKLKQTRLWKDETIQHYLKEGIYVTIKVKPREFSVEL